MNIGDGYVQFTKLLAGAMCIAYIIQIAATFVMICFRMELADPLLALLKNALGFYGLIYGCYAGNSAVEKARQTKTVVESIIDNEKKDSVG